MEKKIGQFENKTPDISVVATTAVLNTKICQVEKKIPDTIGLPTISVLNTKIGQVERKFLIAQFRKHYR